MKNRQRALLRVKPFLLAIIIVALSLSLVLAMDTLEKRHALRMDFSFNSVTTQSEQTREIMKNLAHPVHAYVLFTPGNEDQALLGLLNRLAAQTDQFTYSAENLVQNPMLVNRMSTELGDDLVSADSLVLTCEATGRTRVLNTLNYLEQSFDADKQAFVLSGLAYEKSIAEALLYITLDEVPTIALLTGHGELGQSDTEYMELFLTQHHFGIKRVNLLSGDSLSKDDLLMILAPQKDLLEQELKALTDFASQGGAFFISTDYSDPDRLPNFDALYRMFGFERKSGIVIADGADTAAYIDNPLFLTPYMNTTEPTAPLIGAGQTRLRLPGARALGILSLADNPQVDPLLTSGYAYIKDVNRANESLAREEGDEEGQFYLALLSDYAHNDGTHARAMMIGNSAILVDAWLHEVTYGSQFLLHMVNYLSTSEPININILPKPLVREQLSIAKPWIPILLIIVLPILVAALAVPLLYRRSRR